MKVSLVFEIGNRTDDNPLNTAKVSSPIVLPRTVSYDAGTNQPRRGDTYLKAGNMADQKQTRRRRSSSILQLYQEPQEPIEQLSDQSALPNLNAQWVNAKGTSKREECMLLTDATICHGHDRLWQWPCRRCCCFLLAKLGSKLKHEYDS